MVEEVEVEVKGSTCRIVTLTRTSTVLLDLAVTNHRVFGAPELDPKHPEMGKTSFFILRDILIFSMTWSTN